VWGLDGGRWIGWGAGGKGGPGGGIDFWGEGGREIEERRAGVLYLQYGE